MQPTIGATPPRVMTIAGTDSGGGAGIAADLRTFAACGVHGCLTVTAVTVQNSVGVTGVHTVPVEIVAAQIEAVAGDIGLDGVKTGMLAGSEIIEAVAAACDRAGIGSGGRTPLVVDPVAASMHGDPLLADDALEVFRSLLFPRATVITPNLDEVRLLVGIDVHDRVGQYEAAKVLRGLGPRYVLVKGGHLRADVDGCVDLLYDGDTFTELPGPRFDTDHTHGSGDSMMARPAVGNRRGCMADDITLLGRSLPTSGDRITGVSFGETHSIMGDRRQPGRDAPGVRRLGPVSGRRGGPRPRRLRSSVVAVRPIRIIGDPVLRIRTRPVEVFDEALSGLVPTGRADWARVTGVDLEGAPALVEGRGFLARCLQHEVDHLDGVIYIDRLVGRNARAARKALKSKGWGVPGLAWDPATHMPRKPEPVTYRRSSRRSSNAKGSVVRNVPATTPPSA